MSSRRRAVLPVRTSSELISVGSSVNKPVSTAASHSSSSSSRNKASSNQIKAITMRSPTVRKLEGRLEPPITSAKVPSSAKARDLNSQPALPKTKISVRGNLVAAKPLWQSVKSFGRTPPSSRPTSTTKDSEDAKKEEEMATSTESSGVYSDSENRVIKHPAAPKALHQLGPSSRIAAAMTKTATKFSSRPNSSPSNNNDQFLINELRNQILSLKNQQQDQQDQLERLRNELGEKFQNELANALVEKEAQFQKQMEEKEASWAGEMSHRLQEERCESERLLAEREAAVDASRAEERKTWQQTLDDLTAKAEHLKADRDRLEKNIRQEVDTRVQATVQRYNELQKETMSLQAVYELRCTEVRSLRQELERASAAAAEAAALRERNHTLVNTVEGLEAQLELKSNEERRLHAEIQHLTILCKEDSAKIRRLSMEKEELMYRLQHRDCDRLSPGKTLPSGPLSSTTAETPTRLSKRTLPPINLSPIVAENGASCHNGHDNGRKRNSATAASTSDVDEVFNSSTEAVDPPSPTVRDFTEKNDSVSYVLDLGGEHSPPAFLGGPLLVPPSSPFAQRRRNLVRFSSLRYSHHSHS